MLAVESKTKSYLIILIIGIIGVIGAISVVSLSTDETKVEETDMVDKGLVVLTEEESTTVKLHKMTVQNLVGNLIDVFDKDGLEGLIQADLVMHLTRTESGDGNRYLFIIDPVTDIVIAHPGELNNGKSRELLIQNTKQYLNLISDPNNKDGFWLQEVYKLPNTDDSYEQLIWLVPHDNLIFGTGYVINEKGIPQN